MSRFGTILAFLKLTVFLAANVIPQPETDLAPQGSVLQRPAADFEPSGEEILPPLEQGLAE